METIFLRLLHFLGKKGYYARNDSEKVILSNLIGKGFVKIKKGTKNIFLLTPEGENSLEIELKPNNKINDDEFLVDLRKAYVRLANPMNPLVKIPDIRNQLKEKRIPDSLFNEKVLKFHDQGVLTLQTALSKSHALYGGIESNTNTGIFYYMMFDN